MQVEISEPARTKIQQFRDEEGANDKALRLSVVRTHCMGGRGHGYDLHVAQDAREGDATVEAGGLTLVVDRESSRKLESVQIDYVDSFQESGFRVTNSHARGKCPCGHHDLFD
jgi:iron-sulfur cluster assembly protein